MRVLGISCTKNKMDWAVVEGDDQQSAKVLAQKAVTAPAGLRGEELTWVRREMLELLDRYRVERVAVKVAVPGGLSVSLGRSEVEGVVQEAAASFGVDQVRVVAQGTLAAFKAKNKAALALALDDVPAIKATAVSRRDPVVSAVAQFPR